MCLSRSDGTWNSLLQVGHFSGRGHDEGGGDTPGDDVSHAGDMCVDDNDSYKFVTDSVLYFNTFSSVCLFLLWV